MPKVKWVDEFKAFAMRGNVVDMAIGIIIGAAFGKIVSSFVTDVIMPPIGVLVGGVDFKDLHIVLKEAVGSAPAVTLNYGNFIQVVFDFLIVAFAIFMMIKALAMAKKKSETKKEEVPAPVEPSKEEALLTEIRDLLKKN
ncbi:MAG TPA: large-conductance mechanosensitive channel protein MscL [Bacteroidales bacterium]|nr:large-conductance mechanosensitive channel protein MscL [Bacteroidales bacterium]